MSGNPLVIGLVGFAGSGKDTLAAAWIATEGFIRMSPGDALYEEVAEAFDVNVEWMLDRSVKEQPTYLMALTMCKDKNFVNVVLENERAVNPKMSWAVELNKPRSPREIQQLWGTEYRRAEDPDYWVKKLDEKVQRSEYPVVITSVRFENEADLIMKSGGVLVRVNRPGIGALNDHISEKYARDGFCHIEFNNNVPLEDLPDKAIELLRRIEAETAFESIVESIVAENESGRASMSMF